MNYIEIIILVFHITFVEAQIIDLKASYIMELGNGFKYLLLAVVFRFSNLLGRLVVNLAHRFSSV